MVSFQILFNHQFHCEKIDDYALTLFKVRNNEIYLSHAKDHIVYGRFDL